MVPVFDCLVDVECHESFGLLGENNISLYPLHHSSSLMFIFIEEITSSAEVYVAVLSSMVPSFLTISWSEIKGPLLN